MKTLHLIRLIIYQEGMDTRLIGCHTIKYGKVSFIVLVPEWVVDEGGAEGYRSFIVDCHAVVRAQVDGLVQEHDELGNTVT